MQSHRPYGILPVGPFVFKKTRAEERVHVSILKAAGIRAQGCSLRATTYTDGSRRLE